MKKSSSVAVLILAVVIAVLAVNALRLRSRQVEVAANDEVVPPAAAAAQRLAQAVRFRTISTQQASSFVGAEFDHFRAFLAARYPRVGKSNLFAVTTLYLIPVNGPIGSRLRCARRLAQ
jgi:carboxypeptidase PM20D1